MLHAPIEVSCFFMGEEAIFTFLDAFFALSSSKVGFCGAFLWDTIPLYVIVSFFFRCRCLPPPSLVVCRLLLVPLLQAPLLLLSILLFVDAKITKPDVGQVRGLCQLFGLCFFVERVDNANLLGCWVHHSHWCIQWCFNVHSGHRHGLPSGFFWWEFHQNELQRDSSNSTCKLRWLWYACDSSLVPF